MARIKYGSIATEIRGSIGGQTFQGNAYGFTIKNKPNMARLQSQSQNEVHRMVTFITQYWEQITQAQRDAWNAWAISHPVTSKHNPLANLSGYAYFLKYNMIRCQDTVSPLDEPTAGILNLPALAPTLDRDGSYLWFENHPAPAEMNYAFNVYLSPPQRKTQSFNNSKTRYCYHGSLANNQWDVAANYIANFGKLPSPGDTIFCEVQPWGLYSPYIPQSQYFVLTVS